MYFIIKKILWKEVLLSAKCKSGWKPHANLLDTSVDSINTKMSFEMLAGLP